MGGHPIYRFHQSLKGKRGAAAADALPAPTPLPPPQDIDPDPASARIKEALYGSNSQDRDQRASGPAYRFFGGAGCPLRVVSPTSAAWTACTTSNTHFRRRRFKPQFLSESGGVLPIYRSKMLFPQARPNAAH